MVYCHSCGAPNDDGYQFCSRCGLAREQNTAAQGTAYSLLGEPSTAHEPYLPDQANPETAKMVERTKTGAILLLVAVLLNWIPIIEYLGLLLGAVGAIMLILGRNAFGSRHSTFVIGSVVAYIIGFAVAFAGAAVFASSLVLSSGVPSSSEFLSAFNTLLETVLISEAIISLSFVLVLFVLENSIGRVAVIAGLIAQVGASVAVIASVYPVIRRAITSALSTAPPNTAPLTSAQQQISGFTTLHLLFIVPAVLFAAGYATVILRINRGELPKKGEQLLN